MPFQVPYPISQEQAAILQGQMMGQMGPMGNWSVPVPVNQEQAGILQGGPLGQMGQISPHIWPTPVDQMRAQMMGAAPYPQPVDVEQAGILQGGNSMQFGGIPQMGGANFGSGIGFIPNGALGNLSQSGNVFAGQLYGQPGQGVGQASGQMVQDAEAGPVVDQAMVQKQAMMAAKAKADLAAAMKDAEAKAAQKKMLLTAGVIAAVVGGWWWWSKREQPSV